MTARFQRESSAGSGHAAELHGARAKPIQQATGDAGVDLLERFLPILARELRAPLNRIQSWSHVLENELARTLTQESGRGTPLETAPLAQHALAGVRNGVRDQAQLIDQLRDCASAMDGSLTLEPRPTLLMPVLESSLDAARSLAAARQIQIVTDCHAVDARARVDAQALRQALLQLLSNAIKFSPEGGKVRLILRRERGDVTITVADEGQGVRSGTMPRLFNWFERGDSRQPGLGLGLTEFSMHPSSVLEVKRLIIESDVGRLRGEVSRLLADTDPQAQRDRLEALTQI